MVAGRTRTQWLTAWNRWAFSVTAAVAARGNDCLPQDDSSPVRFLAVRTRVEHVYEVHCTIAAGRYVMLGQPGVSCTDVESHPRFPNTPSGLTRCVRDFWPRAADPRPRVVLDGQAIAPGPVIHTGFYRFRVPARDNQMREPGLTRVGASGIGRATMLRPLPPGPHTLILGFRYRGEHNMALVYKLTVV